MDCCNLILSLDIGIFERDAVHITSHDLEHRWTAINAVTDLKPCRSYRRQSRLIEVKKLKRAG